MAEQVITGDALGRAMVGAGGEVSRMISRMMRDDPDVRSRGQAVMFDLACRTAFQIGVSVALRIARMDAIGADDLRDAFDSHVHHGDDSAIDMERVVARLILEEVYR